MGMSIVFLFLHTPCTPKGAIALFPIYPNLCILPPWYGSPHGLRRFFVVLHAMNSALEIPFFCYAAPNRTSCSPRMILNRSVFDPIIPCAILLIPLTNRSQPQPPQHHSCSLDDPSPVPSNPVASPW